MDMIKAFISALFCGYTVVPLPPNLQKTEENKIIQENQIDKIIITGEEGIRIEKNLELIDISRYGNSSVEGEIAHIQTNSEDIIVISYTSGTSGNESKGVKSSLDNISFVSKKYKELYKLSNESKIMTILPLWHNYGMFACLTSAMVSGAKLLVMDKWDQKLFLNIVSTYSADTFPGSPYMYLDLIKDGGPLEQLKSLKVCDSGGDTLPVSVIEKFEEKTMARITEGYGLTETTSLTHFNISAKDRKIGSIGKAIEGVECEIRDENGNIVEEGKWGMLWLKGRMVFKGYVNENLNDKVLKNGWFNTMDIVRKDKEGFYFLFGRYSDIKTINSEIKVRDIEDRMCKIENIKRVFVDVIRGEEELYYDIYLSLKDITDKYDFRQYIESIIPNVQIAHIYIFEELPTTKTGKIKRKEVKEKCRIT